MALPHQSFMFFLYPPVYRVTSLPCLLACYVPFCASCGPVVVRVGDDLRVDLDLDFKTACFGGEEKVRHGSSV